MTEPQSALARATIDQLAGVEHDPEEINVRLQLARESCTLIAPSPQVGTLAGGCGVAISVHFVNGWIGETGHGPDVYAVADGLALRKHVIDTLGASLGVSWDPVRSQRTDDRGTLHYWAFRAVGMYRQWDGTPVGLSDEYEIDARDKGERVQELWDTPRKAGESDGDWQDRIELLLRKIRKYGLAMAASGARLRALTQIGLKRAYTPEELARPFVTARLHFDGYTQNEAERELYAIETARAMLGGVQALYGEAEMCGCTNPLNFEARCIRPRGHTGRHETIRGAMWDR